jgi:hypothetical protein
VPHHQPGVAVFGQTRKVSTYINGFQNQRSAVVCSIDRQRDSLDFWAKLLRKPTPTTHFSRQNRQVGPMAFPREIVEYISILQNRKNSKYASKERRKFVRQLTILEHVGEPKIASFFRSANIYISSSRY